MQGTWNLPPFFTHLFSFSPLCREDRILLDANLLEKESLKDGDLLIANIRAAQILAGKTCPAFFLVRGDGCVAVWGDMSLGVPRHLRELQQVVACKGAWAALMDGQVVVWGHPRLIPEKVVLEELKDVRQLCVTWMIHSCYLFFGEGKVKASRFLGEMLGFFIEEMVRIQNPCEKSAAKYLSILILCSFPCQILDIQ